MKKLGIEAYQLEFYGGFCALGWSKFQTADDVGYYHNATDNKTCWDSPLEILSHLIKNKIPTNLQHSVKEFIPVMTSNGNHTDYIKIVF